MNDRTSRRNFLRMAGVAGIGVALSTTLLERAVWGQSSRPLADSKDRLDFVLDKPIRMSRDNVGGVVCLALKNAAGEPWILIKEAQFGSPKPGSITGKMTYQPLYRAGVVSVVALTFFDAKDKLVARTEIRCPSESGIDELGYPVYVTKTVDFQTPYAPDERIAKFGVSLAQESEK